MYMIVIIDFCKAGGDWVLTNLIRTEFGNFVLRGDFDIEAA
jgi:hypothetical protein